MQEINRDFLTLSFGTTVEVIKKDKLNRKAPTCFEALKRIVYITLIPIGESIQTGTTNLRNKYEKGK